MKTKKTPTKVAFVGASCVGKSTLLTELQRQLGDRANAIFIEEQARKYFEDKKIPATFSHEHQVAIQDRVLAAEKQAHSKAPNLIICDRSVLDPAMYVSTFIGREAAQALVDKVVDWLPTYAQIYLLDPADVPYETDAIRQESIYERDRMHNEFLHILNNNKVAHELLSGTTPERAARVLGFIEQ